MPDDTKESNDPSLTDVILLLETYYDNGVTHRRKAEAELRKYRGGVYRPKTTVITSDRKDYSQPDLDYRYRQWINSVTQALSLKVIPVTIKAQFKNSESTLVLDSDLNSADSRVTNTAYEASLQTLRGVIEELKSSHKILSLKLVSGSLYLHVEPDDADEHIHDLAKDSPLEKLFNYLYSHQGELIERGHIVMDSRGYTKERNLSEDLRAIGITRQLKQLFFPVSKTDQIKFVNKAIVGGDKLAKILTELKTDS